MIFKNFGELVDYVLEFYPYQKIITYCQDLGYKYVVLEGRRINSTTEFKESNIKELLKVALSYYYRNYILRDTDQTKWTPEQKIIAEICIHSNYFSSNYFTVHLREDSIIISFKYKYIGWWWFGKYNSSTPYTNPRWGNSRTKVVMKFREKIL